MNQFKYSLDNKRYHTYNYYLKNKYHQKVIVMEQKAMVVVFSVVHQDLEIMLEMFMII